LGGKKKTISVPVGLEQLLYIAAGDAEFRAELIRDRARAAERRGLELTGSERAVLAIAPDEQLEAMIDHIDASEQNLAKRRFMRAVAATAVTLAAGTGLGACGCSGDKPAAPQTDAPFHGQAQKVQVDPPPVEPAGTRPLDTIEDLPPVPKPVNVEIDDPKLNLDGGARPIIDIDDPEPNTKGGARPDSDEEPLEPRRPEVEIESPEMKTGGISVGEDPFDQ
jgi:hypothetical protein